MSCQNKDVESNRKRVAIHTEDTVFGSALRLLLDGHQVDLVSVPVDAHDGTDVLVWHMEGALPEEAVRIVARRVPTLVVGSETEMLRAVDAGCRGFLPNSSSLEEVRDAVTTIADGGAVVHPALLGTLLRHLVERRRHDREKSRALDGLTRREAQVFRLAANGAGKEEIGERLFISPATARTHLQRVYRKLGVHSHAQLMALAMRVGAVEIEEDSEH